MAQARSIYTSTRDRKTETLQMVLVQRLFPLPTKKLQMDHTKRPRDVAFWSHFGQNKDCLFPVLWLPHFSKIPASQNSTIRNLTFLFRGIRERAEYCFESTVSEQRTHWVLRQTRWVLRETRWVRVYTQTIGWKELTEFAPRNSVSPEKLTEFGVWNRTPRNRIRPVPEVWGSCFWGYHYQNVFWGGVLWTCQSLLSGTAWVACTISFCSMPYPQYGWHFPEEIPEKFWKDPGNALRAFPGIPVESTAGMPQTL